MKDRQKEIKRRLARVLELPLREQAICVFTAAEMSLPDWEGWENANRLPPLASELRRRFQRWLNGKASDGDLGASGDELFKVLPEDLTKMENPSAGEAGYALMDVSMIALDKCEEVHEDILCTAIFYAAAAATNTRKPAISISRENLTTVECDFLDRWWTLCCQQVPMLT